MVDRLGEKREINVCVQRENLQIFTQTRPSFHFDPLQPDFEAIGLPKGNNKDIFRGHFIANFGNQGDYIGNFKIV